MPIRHVAGSREITLDDPMGRNGRAKIDERPINAIRVGGRGLDENIDVARGSREAVRCQRVRADHHEADAVGAVKLDTNRRSLR